MSIESDVTFWKQVFNWLWVPFVALVGWFLKDMKTKVDDALPRSEFDGYIARSDKSREELRSSVISLFNEVKEIRIDINEKYVDVIKAVHESRKEQK